MKLQNLSFLFINRESQLCGSKWINHILKNKISGVTETPIKSPWSIPPLFLNNTAVSGWLHFWSTASYLLRAKNAFEKWDLLWARNIHLLRAAFMHPFLKCILNNNTMVFPRNNLESNVIELQQTKEANISHLSFFKITKTLNAKAVEEVENYCTSFPIRIPSFWLSLSILFWKWCLQTLQEIKGTVVLRERHSISLQICNNMYVVGNCTKFCVLSKTACENRRKVLEKNLITKSEWTRMLPW